MIIIFFMRYYKNKREYLTFSLCIFIFLLVIFPMALIRIDTTGNDGIVSHFSAGPIYYATTAEESADTLENIYLNFLIKGIFFGIAITSIACYQGYFTSGGANGVGKSTTASVVFSCMTIFILDYVLAELLL